MSYWDHTTQTIVSFPPEPDIEHPGWQTEDCGCCAGLEWGGDEPRECRTCDGRGEISRHLKTGTLARWPGGPFIGKETPR